MNKNLNSSNVKIWLHDNLKDKNRIKACSDNLDKVPKTKGIYFWFMNPMGYKELSNFISIKALPSVYQVPINGKLHDLVYLGTAGARNNKSGTNNGNIFQRLQWHITDNQGTSALCNGTMSTFRRTLASLLASDLIEDNIQDRLNEFLCKYFHIYYVEYVGEFAIVQDQIEKDEELLIQKLKPIFNLSKNPNNKIPNTITHSIGKRRQSIEKKSKAKWCNSKVESLSKASAPTKKKTKNENITSPDSCITFTLKRNENIATKACQIKGLPEGPCTIELFYENRNDIRRYINGKIRVIRTENRSVSSYFSAPDPTVANKPKWQIVQEEMNDKKNPIELITVRVCKLGKNSSKNPKPLNLKKHSNLDDFTSDINISKKFKVVMICSSRKNESFFQQYPAITFTNTPQLPHEKFPDSLMPNSKLTWREYLNTCQNENTLLMAYELYIPNIYNQLHNHFEKRFFILSAGWGLVNSEFRLPYYNITFAQNGDVNSMRNINPIAPPIYNDYNHINEPDEDIVFVGSPSYIPLFILLTENLNSHKIVYYKNCEALKYLPLANETFEFRYYDTPARLRWYYQLAHDLCNNILP